MVEDTPPDFTGIIKRELEKGLQGEGPAKFETSRWFEFFGFRTNPFERDLILENPRLFCDRISEIKYFSNLIGYQKKKGEFYHVAIVGPSGRGKATLLTALHTMLSQTSQGIKGFVADFAGKYFLPEKEEIKTSFLMSPEFTDNDYLFLVNCIPKQSIVEWLTRALEFNKLVVTSWNPFQYDLMRRNFFLNMDFCAPQKVIFLLPLETPLQEELIQLRLKQYGDNDTLDDGEIRELISFTGGNLRLLLFLLEKGYREAFAQGRKFAEKADFARAIEDINLVAGEIKLSPTEVILLRYIIDQLNRATKVTPSEVAEALQWDTAQSWRYFKKLTSYGILEKRGHGKKTEYDINFSILALAENYFTKNYLMQEKTPTGT